MCPWHQWGDEFDFGGLYKVEVWINKAYRRMTGEHMMTKEKWGTLRYEYEYMWMKSKEQTDLFLEILKRATIKFPDFAGEIVDDIVPSLDYMESNKAAYYKGYFEAILWVKHQSKWETCK
jgi:hypothetical protein